MKLDKSIVRLHSIDSRGMHADSCAFYAGNISSNPQIERREINPESTAQSFRELFMGDVRIITNETACYESPDGRGMRGGFKINQRTWISFSRNIHQNKTYAKGCVIGSNEIRWYCLQERMDTWSIAVDQLETLDQLFPSCYTDSYVLAIRNDAIGFCFEQNNVVEDYWGCISDTKLAAIFDTKESKTCNSLQIEGIAFKAVIASEYANSEKHYGERPQVALQYAVEEITLGIPSVARYMKKTEKKLCRVLLVQLQDMVKTEDTAAVINFFDDHWYSN